MSDPPVQPASPADAVTAAAITYRRVPLPDELTDEYGSIETVSTTAYELRSLDGHTGLALHLAPAAPAGDGPIFVAVHGSGGSVRSEPIRPLSVGLAELGYPVLAINTRGSADALNADNLYATISDVGAAHRMAASLGHKRIVLFGHSLGTLQVSCYAATHWSADIVGVLCTGTFADLPWKSRHLLINDETVYAGLRQQALAAVADRDFARVLDREMPWLLDRTTPVSADHFLTYRCEGISGARSLDWVSSVPYPMLFIRDENDPIILKFEENQIRAATAGALSPDVQVVSLPSDAGSNGHHFVTSISALVSTVEEWAKRLP